jgi:hypothetical protein
MRRLSIAVVALAILSSMAAGQEFTPDELEDMVKSAFSGCMKTQLNHPDNAGADRSILQAYCRCTAHKTAARTTRREVDEFKKNDKLAHATMIAKSHQIGQECRTEIARKHPGFG